MTRPRFSLMILALWAVALSTMALSQRARAPVRARWSILRNAGDTLVVKLTYGSNHATGALWTVRATATNGTWAGLPVKAAVGATGATMAVNAIPWDSVTFTATLWGTNGTLVSKDSTISAPLKLRHLPGAPTVPSWDTSGTVIGLFLVPSDAAVAIGEGRQICAFIVFKDLRLAERTVDYGSCDTLYQRVFTVAQRAVSAAQQLCADTSGYCYNAGSGLQTKWLPVVQLGAR